MFSRCFYTRVARVWAGSFRLAYAPACVAVFGVQTPLSCLSCARVCVCLRFTWHLHVVGVCFEADSSRLSCDIYTGKKNTTWQPVKWEVKGQRGLCGQKGVGGSSRVGLGWVSRSCTCPFFFLTLMIHTGKR